MSVILPNSNSLPDTLRGAYSTNTFPPPSIKFNSNNSPQGTSESLAPIQVMGLVPVFPCCGTIDALGGFQFGSFDVLSCSGISIVLDINLGGVDLGTFTYDNTQSNTTIQANIQALLPAGWVCVVSGVPTKLTCIIYAPSGSGSSGNKTLVVTRTNGGCGGVINTLDISGGSYGGTDCIECDCREGKYLADSIPDVRKFTLPVFADLTCTDVYHNDINQWVFMYPGTVNPIQNGDFKLQKLLAGVWTDEATLNDTTYGTPFSTATSCTVNYGGFQLNWNLVLQNLGEGTYRFKVEGIAKDKSTYCLNSPPFCLKQFDCNLVDGTVKFETSNSGGNVGSVITQGQSWSLCCQDPTTKNFTPLSFYDSIRFWGFFGYETAELQREQIKYATGEIKKTRDEAIKNFTFKSSQLPLWLHQRLYAYGLMSDQLFVSDYNINNSDYNLKHFWVVADSGYAPKYYGYTRYTKVLDVKFKEGQQFVFRDRCCGGNPNSSPGNAGGIHFHTGGVVPQTGTGITTNGTDRQWDDGTAHEWDDGTPANWE